MAVAALTSAVLFSFVYTLSIATVARYQTRWRNVFTGNIIVLVSFCTLAMLAINIPIVTRYDVGVNAAHIAAAALLALRNTVYPLMITLNLVKVTLWCEALAIVFFAAGLLSFRHFFAYETAILAAFIAQAIPFLYVSFRFLLRKGKFAKPIVSVTDGFSGVFDALFGSLATNGTRLAIVASAGSVAVTPLALFRVGIGLVYAFTNLFFLFLGRRTMKELKGGGGTVYVSVIKGILVLLCVNFIAGSISAYFGYPLLSIISFCVTMFSVSIILYYIRFKLFGFRRLLTFSVLSAILYIILLLPVEIFVQAWTGLTAISAAFVVFSINRHARKTPSSISTS